MSGSGALGPRYFNCAHKNPRIAATQRRPIPGSARDARQKRTSRLMPVCIEPVPMAHKRQIDNADSALRADATASIKCCVPGCGNDKAPDFPLRTHDGPCVYHLSLASPQSRRLLSSAARRLATLQRSWNDEKIFEAIIVRGRYLAFCSLLERVDDRVARSWERLRSEILAATGDADLASPGIAPTMDQPEHEHRLGAGPAALDPNARASPAPQE